MELGESVNLFVIEVKVGLHRALNSSSSSQKSNWEKADVGGTTAVRALSLLSQR